MSDPKPPVAQIVAKVLGKPEDEITENTALADICMDSLKMVELIVALEAAYDFRFSEDHLIPSSFETLKSIRDALTTSLAET